MFRLLLMQNLYNAFDMVKLEFNCNYLTINDTSTFFACGFIVSIVRYFATEFVLTFQFIFKQCCFSICTDFK